MPPPARPLPLPPLPTKPRTGRGPFPALQPTKKALCLSGGGARGSFQMGAIKCLYTVYGFRPDVIVGTSVGSLNGAKLAEGSTPDSQLRGESHLLLRAGKREAEGSQILSSPLHGGGHVRRLGASVLERTIDEANRAVDSSPDFPNSYRGAGAGADPPRVVRRAVAPVRRSLGDLRCVTRFVRYGRGSGDSILDLLPSNCLPWFACCHPKGGL
jgi:hypothetical protein